MLLCGQCNRPCISVLYDNTFDENKCIVCQVNDPDCKQLVKTALNDFKYKKINEVLNSLNSIIDIVIKQCNNRALARLYLEIAKVYKMNDEEIQFMKYLNLSAELGHPEAQFHLGLRYVKLKEVDLAIYCLLESAEQNFLRSIPYCLDLMFSKVKTLENEDELIDIMIDRMIPFCRFFFKPNADSNFQIHYVEHVGSIYENIIKMIE